MENAIKMELKEVDEESKGKKENNGNTDTNASKESKESRQKNTGKDETKKENKDKKCTEEEFWMMLAKTLKPESVSLSDVEELKQKLRNLRNLSVLIIFLINVMWIVFLYTLVFPQLSKYNLPDKAFSLLFLFIFSVIVLIQFVAMIFHRFKTLLHLLAGVRSNEGSLTQSIPTTKKVKAGKKAGGSSGEKLEEDKDDQVLNVTETS